MKYQQTPDKPSSSKGKERKHRTNGYTQFYEDDETPKSTSKSRKKRSIKSLAKEKKRKSYDKENEVVHKKMFAIPSGSFPNSRTISNLVSTDSSSETGQKDSQENSRKSTPKKKEKSPIKKSRDGETDCNKSTPKKKKSPIKVNEVRNKQEKNSYSCPTCRKPFISPILLCCGHTFCKDCVTLFVEASNGCSFDCPVCMSAVILGGDEEELFCPNFMILKELEDDNQDTEAMCSVCSGENEVEYFCEKCNDLLCDTCANAHRIVKYTRDHIVTEITNGTDISCYIKKRYYCNEHEEEELDIYCETCERSLCRECALQLHRGKKHNCVPLKIAAQLYRDEIEKVLYDFKARTPNLQLALMDIKRKKKTLRDQANTAYAEINESVRRIMTSLKEKERSLYKDLEKIYKKKTAVLKSAKHDVILKLERFEALSVIIEQLGSHDNDVETLQIKETIKESIKRIEHVSTSVELKDDAVLFCSNEATILQALSSHGKMSKISSKGNRTNKKSIFCDFGNESSTPDKDYEPQNNKSSSQSLRSDAKRLRAYSNWKIVKSKINEVARSKCSKKVLKVESKRNALASKIKKKEISEARKEKARANWLILRSHISELRNKSIQGKFRADSICHHNNKKETMKNRKAIHSKALRLRAEANWLLVKSKLSEIIIFGCVSGRSFKPLTNSSQILKKTSPTMMKLRAFRAKKLRARANWLLVASRLHDIANYEKRKYQKKEKITWDTYRKCLEKTRDKASQNKILAGQVRGKANWMIVKSRLPEIIMFGKYHYYKNIDFHLQYRHCSPAKLPLCKKSKNFPTKQELTSQRKKAAFHNWNKLVRKHKITGKKSDKSETRKSKSSNSRTSSKSNKRKNKDAKKSSSSSFKYWDRLIQGTTVKNNDQFKSGDKLIGNFNKNPWNYWDKLMFHTPISEDNRNSLEHWNNLIRHTKSSREEKAALKNGKSLKNWDALIRQKTNPKGDRNSLQSWDKLIRDTTLSKRDNDSFKNWNKLIMHTTTEDNESLKHWSDLIHRTRVQKENNDSLENWDRLIRCANIKNSCPLRDWSNLISGTTTASPKKISKHPRKNSEQKEISVRHWNDLISSSPKKKVSYGPTTPKRKDRSFSPQQVIPLQEYELQTFLVDDLQESTREESFGHSQELIEGRSTKSKKSPKKRSTISKGEDDSVKKWYQLIHGTKNDSLTHWWNLIQGTPVCKKDERVILSNWSKLINGTPATSKHNNSEDDEDYSDAVELSEKYWHRLVDSSKHDKKTAEENWTRLCANAAYEKSQAEKNWRHLIKSTKSKASARGYEKWRMIGDSFRNFNEILPGRENDANDSSSSRSSKPGKTQKDWWQLITGTTVSNSSKTTSPKARKTSDVLSNCNDLYTKAKTKVTPYERWMMLIQATDSVEESSKTEMALTNWRSLIHGLNVDKDLFNKEAYKHWHQLISLTEGMDVDEIQKNWFRLLNSVNVNKRELANRNWDHLVQNTTSQLTQSATRCAFEHWAKLLEGRVLKPPENFIYFNWFNLIDERNPFIVSDEDNDENWDEENAVSDIPDGMKILYDRNKSPVRTTQPKIIRLSVKNNVGMYSDMFLKVSSPDHSILSAHIEPNRDGTYTVYCCPTIQKNFNISVSLNGPEFEGSAKVLSISGNFANLTKSEEVLANRTISLIQWQLTPGLVVQDGESLVAGDLGK